MRLRTAALAALLLACVFLSSCGGFEIPILIGSRGDSGTTETAKDAPPSDTDGDRGRTGYISVPECTPGDVLGYFNEVALKSEYGEDPGVLCRWEDKIVYEIKGDATEEDITLIEDLAARLNSIEGFPGIRRASGLARANLVISFTDRDDIAVSFEAADENCAGMAEYTWDANTGKIFEGRAAIDKELTDERKSTICEEFLQSLGPANDSYKYITSVFYQGFCTAQTPADVDWAVMEMIYSPRLHTGMRAIDAIGEAAKLLAWD